MEHSSQHSIALDARTAPSKVCVRIGIDAAAQHNIDRQLSKMVIILDPKSSALPQTWKSNNKAYPSSQIIKRDAPTVRTAMRLKSCNQFLQLWGTDLSSVLLRECADILCCIDAGKLLSGTNADTVVEAVDQVDHFAHVVLRGKVAVAGAFAVDSICCSGGRYKAGEGEVDGNEETGEEHDGLLLWLRSGIGDAVMLRTE